MKSSAMEHYNEMSKAKYEADDAMHRMAVTRGKYMDAKIDEYIGNMLEVQEEEGKLTEGDLKVFLKALTADIIGVYR